MHKWIVSFFILLFTLPYLLLYSVFSFFVCLFVFNIWYILCQQPVNLDPNADQKQTKQFNLSQKWNKQLTKVIPLKVLLGENFMKSKRPRDVQGFAQESSTVDCVEPRTEPLTYGRPWKNDRDKAGVNVHPKKQGKS